MTSTDHKPNDQETQCKSFEALLDQLPRESLWKSGNMYQWRGFWFTPKILKATLAMPLQFESRYDDVLLASSLKVGTTWLKALCLSIMHLGPNLPNGDGQDQDILSKGSPHIHVPTIEAMVAVDDPYAILAGMPSPRLLHTHLPYSLLPPSIDISNCKMVYITRDPKDTFISFWMHMNLLAADGIYFEEPLPLEKAFQSFCDGVHLMGPFFDHVLEYYKASLELPQKILFLKYEDLKSDPKGQVQRIASFLGRPFRSQEQVEQVLRNCDFERLKNLQVNKEGINPHHLIPNSIFFRRGVTGDSKNYMTTEMEEQLDQITRVKLEGTDLYLNA